MPQIKHSWVWVVPIWTLARCARSCSNGYNPNSTVLYLGHLSTVRNNLFLNYLNVACPLKFVIWSSVVTMVRSVKVHPSVQNKKQYNIPITFVSFTIWAQGKTYLILTCAPNEDSNQPAHPRSHQSPRCPYDETMYRWLSKMRTVKILIRLRECAVRSESSLDAHVRRYSFRRCGSIHS